MNPHRIIIQIQYQDFAKLASSILFFFFHLSFVPSLPSVFFYSSPPHSLSSSCCANLKETQHNMYFHPYIFMCIHFLKNTDFFSYITTVPSRHLNGNNNPLVPSPSHLYSEFPDCLKNDFLGASLVAQWLRICLPMQGTRVQALVWEDPTCRGATRPVSHNYWACASGACALQQERPR